MWAGGKAEALGIHQHPQENQRSLIFSSRLILPRLFPMCGAEARLICWHSGFTGFRAWFPDYFLPCSGWFILTKWVNCKITGWCCISFNRMLWLCQEQNKTLLISEAWSVNAFAAMTVENPMHSWGKFLLCKAGFVSLTCFETMW